MAWQARTEGKRPRGRSQQTWKEGIQKILKERRIEWKGMRATARDHERWKTFFFCKSSTPTGRRGWAKWGEVQVSNKGQLWSPPLRNNCNRLKFLFIPRFIKKVKCTLVQALRLCTDRTAHRGSRGIALLFHDHSTRKGWGVSVTPWPLFTPGKDPVPIVQEAGWAQGPVWTGAENFAPTGIRSPDHPARSQSLYRLRYPARSFYNNNTKISLTEIINDKYIARTDNHLILPHFKRRDW
jgi:hypothetical protein